MTAQLVETYWRPTADRFARFAARHFCRRTVEAQNDRPIVSFTFDDVDATAATTGAEILERHDVRGTFYVAGALCDLSGDKGPFATREQCRDLARRGHEIGCHTYSHVPVRTLSSPALTRDLDRNATYLGNGNEPPPASFAFPFNAPTLRAKRALARRFLSSRGGVSGINSGEIDMAFLKAVGINDDGISTRDATEWIEQASASNGWLVFFLHDVSAAPPAGQSRSRYGCTPEILEAAVRIALSSGAEVLTMRDAASRVRGMGSGDPAGHIRSGGIAP